MTFSTRQVLVGAGLIILVTAAVTRYSFPQIKTQTVTVEKEVIHNDVRTVVHTVTQPNGVSDTTTTIIDHTVKTDIAKSVSITTRAPTLNISALVANDFSKGLLIPAYGVSVSKQVLGPITVGGFGLTNGTIGLSVGLNF